MILLIDIAGIVLCLCFMAWLHGLPKDYFERKLARWNK